MTEWPLNIARYTTGLVIGFSFVVALGWTYIAAFPMAFLPTGYPVWAAKKQMLDQCDLGALMQFGDSQLEAGIVSHGLPLVAANFSAGGVSPLDSYFLVRQALACPNYPKHAILSFGAEDFRQLQPAFWSNTIRFGILGAPAIADIENTAQRLHDPSFDDFVTFEGFSGWTRNFLYVHHFPPLYFDSLVQGGFFLRENSNRAIFKDALARRGQMPYRGVQAQPPPDRNNPRPAPGFHPLPIETYYFERLVDALEKAGVSIDFIMFPVPELRGTQLASANLARDFVDYLGDVERRHPNLHVSQVTIPVWPDRDFVDEIHLNPEGAEQFTKLLNDCLKMSDADWQSGVYSRSCRFVSPES